MITNRAPAARERRRQWNLAHTDYVNAYGKKWRAANPWTANRHHRRKHYAELLVSCRQYPRKIRELRPLVDRWQAQLASLDARGLKAGYEPGSAAEIRWSYDRASLVRQIKVLGGDLARMEAEAARLAELHAEFGTTAETLKRRVA